jgi:nucleotide-binding universal stress UspA family protein
MNVNHKNKIDTTAPSINKILVPVDRTLLSLKAANYGIHLVEAFKKAKTSSAEEMLRPIEEEAKKKGINIKSEIIYAENKSVIKAITEYADKNHIDVIVVGGGDVSSKKYLIVGGSVANGIVKNSKCPVMVMR